MKLETLRELIKNTSVTQKEIDAYGGNIEDAVIDKVLKYIDLFEKDQEPKSQFPNYPPGVKGFDPFEPLEVPYSEVCSCNPKNGGSGICGCVMGNTMVRNPKRNSTLKSTPSFPPQDCY
jgi:hypothetical protein